jgi:PAS domain S-box-containing protein
MTEAGDIEAWLRRFERERASRKQAEALLHEKSRELFEANLDLAARAADLDRHARRERALAAMSTDLARTETRAGFLSLLRERTPELLGVSCLSMVECRADGDHLFTQLHLAAALAPSGPDSGDRESRPVPLVPGSALAEAIRTGAKLATPASPVDDYPDWRDARTGSGLRHFAIVPLAEASGTLGTLNAAWTSDPEPDDDRVTLLEQLGAVVAAHLRALRAREALARSNEVLEQTVARRTAELRSSEARFVLLFEYAPQPMLMVDADQVIRQVNRGAAALFGYPAEALLGRDVQELVPLEARERHLALVRAFTGEEGHGGARRAGGRRVSALRSDGSSFVADIELAGVEIGGARSTLVGVTDVTEMERAQSALRRSLEEKVTLLQEIHHRVKNNLQIISSLLFLQQDGLPSESAREALQESVFRVRSMALIHEALYGVASLDRIDLHDYTNRLCATLQASLAPRTRVSVTPGHLTIGIDVAVPVGLILNELVTNALKYGVPLAPDVPPCVAIELAEGETHCEMRVRDNGPGLRHNPLEAGRTGLGLQLVNSLTRQLRGKITLEPGQGTTFHLRWPRSVLGEPAAT